MNLNFEKPDPALKQADARRIVAAQVVSAHKYRAILR